MPAEILIGPAGWSYADWEGTIYPPRPGRSFDPLVYLSEYFNLIEINSTFYRVPAMQTCRRWAERIAHVPDFTFTAKAHRDLTHAKTPPREQTVRAFAASVQPLADANRLGGILVQFPWSFRYDGVARARVASLSDWLAPHRPVFEVRHGSWKVAASFFEDHGIAMCGVDQPQIGDSLPPDHYVPDSGGAYFRLHGRNYRSWFDANAGRDARYDYMYGPTEIEEWRRRIRGVAKRVKRIQVVMNNHFRGQAPANGLELRAAIEARPVPAPRSLIVEFPRLAGTLVEKRDDERDVSAQGDLFRE